MRSEGFPFYTLGGLGVEVCSLDAIFMFATIRNRPQPFATVRNRPQRSATVRVAEGCRAYGKSCKMRYSVDV